VKFSIFTLFPDFFKTPLETSIVGKAKSRGIFFSDIVALRPFGEGSHKVCDDRPYGGGVGMVMMASVLEKAMTATLEKEGLTLESLEAAVLKFKTTGELTSGIPHVIFLSPQGKILNANLSRKFSTDHKHLILICGHYEGVDERFLEKCVHEEVSVGDYILTGGESAAFILLESMVRFLPETVGDMESVNGDTFESSDSSMVPGGLKYPCYTRPQTWRGEQVPAVLMSGNHQEISKYRLSKSLEKTKKVRPDLLEKKKP